MSFYKTYSEYKNLDLDKQFSAVRSSDILYASVKTDSKISKLINLLSPLAQSHLEELAQVAQGLTLQYFGRTIQLYTPLYLSNYCDNKCVYCSFNVENSFKRRKLNHQELEKEAKFISSTGLKHLLILTGESRRESPISYIKECVKILKNYFSSISIEIYPLSEEEYSELITSGVDGLTIYQEVYNESIYSKMHICGPKRDYVFRLEAPERGAKAGMRVINIGALLGLYDWRKEVFFMGLHAKYLQDKFPDAEIGVSLPRLRPFAGDFKVPYPVNNIDIVQIILSLRIFLPRVGISISTREEQNFRDSLIPLGITRMSAGSSTRVGGHTINASIVESLAQFEISDERSVKEIKMKLEEKGYQPVFKDWMHF